MTMWLDKSRCLCLVCSLLPMRRQYRPLDTRYSTLSFIFSYNLLKDHYFGFYIKKEFSLDTLFTAEKFNDRIIWGFFFFYKTKYLNDVMLGEKYSLRKNEISITMVMLNLRSRPPHTNLGHPSPTVQALSIRTGARRYFPP